MVAGDRGRAKRAGRPYAAAILTVPELRSLPPRRREFAALGFGGARVDAIAAQAGVNKRMLYHYFGNKDDLYLAVLEEAYAAIRAAESELVLRHGNPANAMRKLVLFTWQYYREHPEFLSLLATRERQPGCHTRHIPEDTRPELAADRDHPVAAGAGRCGGQVPPRRRPVPALCLDLVALLLLSRQPLDAQRQLRTRPRSAGRKSRHGGEHVVGVIRGYLRPLRFGARRRRARKTCRQRCRSWTTFAWHRLSGRALCSLRGRNSFARKRR